jgi:hypothetical protein
MSTPVPSGAPAGVLEDLSLRMARVETDVAWIKREMATKADLATLRGEIAASRAEMRGEIAASRAELRGEIFAMEGRLIKWMVGTALTSVGVAVTAAKLLA